MKIIIAAALVLGFSCGVYAESAMTQLEAAPGLDKAAAAIVRASNSAVRTAPESAAVETPERFAPVYEARIDCLIKVNGRKNGVSFAVKNLGYPGTKLITLAVTSDAAPVLQGASNQEITSLNAQGGSLSVDKDGNLILIGDDGVSLIKILLSQDTDYRGGFASESGVGRAHWFTTDVGCTVRLV